MPAARGLDPTAHCQERAIGGYRVKLIHIAIAGVADLHIRALRDNQQFFDAGGLAEAIGISPSTWPLFGQVWPSSIALAVHMGQRPVSAGERILELGCGLGLPSLVSHRRGADVTASDRHPLAARFLLKNLRLNGLPPLPYGHADWGDAGSAIALLGPLTHLELQGRFDLIMASDVLYERDDAGGLSGTIERRARRCAEVLIVDPERGNRSAFSERMLALGFVLEQSRLDAAANHLAGRYRGRLLRYLRR